MLLPSERIFLSYRIQRTLLVTAFPVTIFILFSVQPLEAALYNWKEPVSGDFNDPNRWSGPNFQPGVPKSGDDAGMSGPGPTLSHTVTISSAPELRYSYIAYNEIRLLDRLVVTGTNFVQGDPCIISGPGSMDAVFFEAISSFDIDQATVKIDTLEHRNYDVNVRIKNGGLLDTTRDTTFNNYTLNIIVEGSGSRWQHGTHSGPRVTLTAREGGKAMLPSFDGYVLTIEGGNVSVGSFSTTLKMTGGELNTTSGNLSGFDQFMRGGLWTASGIITNQSEFAAENGAVIKSGGGVVSARFDVRGAGTMWEVAGDLRFLDGAIFVEQGGRVVSGTDIDLGPEPDVSGSISVGGVGSRLVLPRKLNVGVKSRASVVVRDQGAMQLAGATLGQDKDSQGFVLVSGAGATLSLDGSLSVGEGGAGEVTVERGGTVTLGAQSQMDLGLQPGGRGEVLVAGNDTTFTSAGNLSVGRKGKGTFNVEGGARVTLGSLGIGESSETNTVRVVESGSTLEVAGAIEIGLGGRGHLDVNTGGTTISGQAELGVLEDTIGTATIQGRGSSWQIARDLTVGGAGHGEAFVLRGATMTVQRGGVHLGAQPGAVGLLTVDGAGSKLEVPAGALRIGVESAGMFTISRGAVVTSQAAQLAVGEGQAQVIVGQDDSTWTINGAIEAGVGDVATLRVDKRALVQAAQGFIARRSGSLGVLQALGDGARLIFSQGLIVGEEGTGVLEVGSGGSVKVTAGEFVLGAGADGEGRVTIGSSAGTLEAESSPTTVGKAGVGVLSVLPQGRLTTGAAQLALETNSTGVVTITGRQARWLVRGPLAVGVRGNATLLVGGKGTVEAIGDITLGPNGRLCGDGTVKAPFVENNGELCPGASPGLLVIEGDYDQTTQGRLEIEFAGGAAGETHDLLTVTGNAGLNGTLRLKFIDGFAPMNGQTFTFLSTTNSILGAFHRIAITGLADGFQYELAATPGTLSMVARSDGIPTSPPRLKIENRGPDIVLSWFGPNTFELQSNNNLANPLGWTPVAAQPVLEGNRHSLALPTSPSPTFFRLRQPSR